MSWHNISADSDNTILNSDAVTVTSLSISSSGVLNLSGIEAFTSLTRLDCSNNQLTSLNLSANTALTRLNCYRNQLTTLNVANGNNRNFIITFSNNPISDSFRATGNPNLRCIQVDDASYSTREWTYKDETAGYSSDCAILSITTNSVSLVIPTSATLWGIVVSDGGSTVTERGFVYSSSNTNPEIGETNVVPVTADGIEAGAFSKIITGLTLGTTYYYKAYAINNSSGTIYGDMQSFSTTTTVSTPIPDENFEQALIDLGIDTNGKNGNILTFDAIGIETLRIAETDIESFAGIEAFTSLTSLICHRNQLTSLDVSANTALTYLNCGQNQLTSLNVSTNTALTYLDCYNNRLTSLDVSANTALTWLNCAINSLSELNVSSNTALDRLECSQNELTSLNVSTNTALTSLDCRENELTSLNVKNRNNRNFVYLGGNYKFRATDNPDLICILVDDAEWSTANWRIKDATAGYSQDCSSLSMITNAVTSITPTSATLVGNIILDSENVVTERGFVYSLSSTAVLTIGGADVLQGVASGTSAGVFTKTITGLTESTTYYYKSYATKNNVTVYGNALNFSTIPTGTTAILDGNFEQALVTLGHDTNGKNGYILNSDAVAVTRLDVTDKRIASLAGIEAFTSLTYLRASVNPLLTLDVSKNTALTALECTGIGLTTLNVSANTALMELDCSSNELTELDVSANKALTILSCGNNKLTDLDVSANRALMELYCGNNRYSSTDNKLTSLDVSANTALTILHCNRISQLTSLNVKNGNNINFTFPYYGHAIANSFIATDNPNLRCIQVDDVAYSTTNWTNKDTAASYSVDCSAISITTNPVISSTITPTSATLVGNISSDGGNTIAERGFVYSSVDTEALTIENTSATKVTSGMGTGVFSKDITDLIAGTTYYYRAYATDDNGMTAYGVAKSFNTIAATTILDPNFERELIRLGYDSGEINGVVLTANIASITSLNVSRKEISNLSGIEAFTSLTYLNCGYNSLTTLDVSANTALTNLFCNSNSLTTLDVSGATALTNINCSFNQLTALNVSTNTALKYLFCNNNSLDELNIFVNTALTSLACYNNSLSELNVSTNTRLTSLICNNNSLDELNISLNTALTVLNCSNNPLDVLNVSANTVLTTLNCSNNSLDELNVSANTALTSLSCYGNSLSTLDVLANTDLTSLICRNNSLSTLDVSKNTALTTLSCRDNLLSTLNVSENTALTVLYCNNNQLTSLNVKNGNNHNFIYRNQIALSFNATGNEDLTCIQVDDVDYSTREWTNKDATASYMTSCSTATTTQVLSLNTGWNLVGFNVEPTDNSVANIFASVSSLVQIDTQTQGYNPSSPSFLNTLKRLENGQGYLIKLNIASQITLTGTSINLSEISVSLSAGWNLISYPSQNIAGVQTALNNISQYIIEVNSQTKGYNSESPDFLNTLRQLKPGEGYWIKVSQNCNLTF